MKFKDLNETEGDGKLKWEFNIDFDDVELSHKGKTIAVMSMEDWTGLVNQFRRIQRSRKG